MGQVEFKGAVVSVVRGSVGVLVATIASCLGCALPKQVVAPKFEVVATKARIATVQVSVELEDDAWTGTGWYVYTDGAKSLVVTAGHVCEPGATYKVEEAGGGVYAGTAVVDSAEYDAVPDDDTCVISVEHRAPATLKLAIDSELSYGDPLGYVGFPGGQIAVIQGRYAGTTGFRLICSVWGYYGASGSALLNEQGEVVGLLVSINPKFPQTTFAVPVEVVRRYVAQALTAGE